ncbi:hypothetical protein SynRS9915_01818 [Synechococcus sp. RS9915]|nr:hypothetical protein SynRS9915_01818 [Synechococcus sp. RS9915]
MRTLLNLLLTLLVLLAESFSTHLQGLRCKGSGFLLLVHTVTNTRVYAAKVS